MMAEYFKTKNKLFLFILCYNLALSVCAIGKDSVNAVTMVSYEQGAHDIEGTLALKNNTEEDIKNLTFIITYLDMAGNEMDYEEFSREVSIASGMTKKINIPAYEWRRNYRYYKTKDEYGLYPSTFKIKFRLKGYNNHSYTAIANQNDDFDDINDYNQSLNTTNHYLYIIGGVVVAVLTLAFCIGIYALVGVMARRRNRDVALWVVLSFVLSPILIIIILLCVGKEEKYK